MFRTRLYGATTKRLYENVCANCEKREGKKKGAPSLVDFHAERDIVEPKGGKIRVEFCFCCYPKCHQSGDSGYLCVGLLCRLCIETYADHFVVLKLYSLNARTRPVSLLNIDFLCRSTSSLGSRMRGKCLHQQEESETGLRWNSWKEHLQHWNDAVFDLDWTIPCQETLPAIITQVLLITFGILPYVVKVAITVQSASHP